MPEEERDYEKTIARLAGEVAALRCIVEAIAGELPERAMYAVSRAALEFARREERQEWERATAAARDYRAGACDIGYEIYERLDRGIDELVEGQRIRTITPYPIAPKDRVDAERGF